MLNLEFINRMKQENELLRKRNTFLQGAKSLGSFSLRVLEAHMLKVVPDLSSPQRFTCMVNVVTGPVEVGMNVAGAAVSAGSVLTSASGLPVGHISNISISGAPKLQSDTFASSGENVSVEITINNPQEKKFTFPSLEKEAEAFEELKAKIKNASIVSPDARFKEIIVKLNEKPPKKLKDPEVEFCREACGLSEEECKLLPSNYFVAVSPSAGGASPAADKTLTSAKNQDATKPKFAAAGGGGKSFQPDSKPIAPSPRDTERKLPVALALDASAPSVSPTGHVPPPTAPTPPQGAAPTSGANAPQARPSSSESEDDDDIFGVSDEALAKYLSKK